MSDQESYQGWDNRETWCLQLWLSNDEGFYRQITDEIVPPIQRHNDGDDAVRALADRLKDWVTSDLKEFADESKEGSPLRVMFDDIGSLWRVNWEEIARAWLED